MDFHKGSASPCLKNPDIDLEVWMTGTFLTSVGEMRVTCGLTDSPLKLRERLMHARNIISYILKFNAYCTITPLK